MEGTSMESHGKLKVRNWTVLSLGLGVLTIGLWSIAAWAQEAPTKPGNSRDSAATERGAVVRGTNEPAGNYAALVDTVESSAATFARLTRDAVENVSFCAKNYLYDSKPSGAGNYRMCVNGATGLFDAQVKKAVKATDAEVSDAVHLIAFWAGVQVRVAAAADADVVAGQEQQSAFADCIADYDANVKFCNSHYPPPPQTTQLSLCLSGAESVLRDCWHAIAN